MKVFVAGGSGAVGARLVPLLVAGGHKVVAMGRSAAKADWLRSVGAAPAWPATSRSPTWPPQADMPGATAEGRMIGEALDSYWDRFLTIEPLFATAVGDARFDDALPDPTEDGRAERHRVHAGLLAAADGIDASRLEPEERRAVALAVALARRELGCLAHGMDRLWAVGHMPIGHRHGPGLLLGVVAFQQPGGTAPRRAAYLRRLAAFPGYLDALAANAREGLASGVVAPRAVVARTVGQVERLLATPVAESPALAPLAGGGGGQERSRGVTTLREQVYPAYARFLDVLRDYLPRAQEALGLGALPGGEETYRSEVLGWTTMPLEPDAVHRLGREHLQQVQDDRMALARRLGHADPAAAIISVLDRPGGRLATREEILALARDQVARSWAALPDWFGRLPARNCAVAPIDAAHEDDLGEYYLAGSSERVGTYFVNTQPPRPAYELAATSFHEANPGHHLQTALELEAPDRHALRRNASELQGAAHVEGWGLYSERLADEMGLYAGDHERLGMLNMQALRAARLVADTGIHAFGWTREQSIETLRASGCDEWLAAAETDRYAAIPGQALTYKLGQLELETLRKQWVARGGDVRDFHDALLGLGLLPLASLRAELTPAERPPQPPRPAHP
jgi:uncharacterized protein (DUF885 family)